MDRNAVRHSHNARGYVLVYRDWYEDPDEPDMLRRNAIVSTLNPGAFKPSENAQIVKRGFAVLNLPDVLPLSFTICECPSVDHDPFDSLEDACTYLREHGVKRPRIGINPIG
jgi:hypothetical protein